MKTKDLPLFKNLHAKKVVQSVCAEHGITPRLLQNLIEIERDYSGSGRADGITERFEGCLKDHLEQQDD